MLADIVIVVTILFGGQSGAIVLDQTGFSEFEDCLTFLSDPSGQDGLEDEIEDTMTRLGIGMQQAEPLGVGCYTAEHAAALADLFAIEVPQPTVQK